MTNASVNPKEPKATEMIARMYLVIVVAKFNL